MTFHKFRGILYTMIIYKNLGKSKKRKDNAKTRKLEADWQAILKKHNVDTKYKPKKDISNPFVVSRPYRREEPEIPSLKSNTYNAFKSGQKTYTGDKIKGIGTLHKSNAVPIFTDDEAKEISRMRR